MYLQSLAVTATGRLRETSRVRLRRTPMAPNRKAWMAEGGDDSSSLHSKRPSRTTARRLDTHFRFLPETFYLALHIIDRRTPSYTCSAWHACPSLPRWETGAAPFAFTVPICRTRPRSIPPPLSAVVSSLDPALPFIFFPLGRASEPSRPVRRLTPSTYSPPIIRRYRWSCRVSYRSFESTMITANGSAPPQALHRASAGRCRHFVRTVVLGIHNIHHPFVQENGRRQEEARILASLVQAQARTDAHS
ncbi:hypothetical protein BJV77DRAFT_756405 [Russula vinacea]|nr:hypothetical protein BJV77DRAFT_756405 [Russula vinacea]